MPSIDILECVQNWSKHFYNGTLSVTVTYNRPLFLKFLS